MHTPSIAAAVQQYIDAQAYLFNRYCCRDRDRNIRSPGWQGRFFIPLLSLPPLTLNCRTFRALFFVIAALAASTALLLAATLSRKLTFQGRGRGDRSGHRYRSFWSRIMQVTVPGITGGRDSVTLIQCQKYSKQHTCFTHIDNTDVLGIKVLYCTVLYCASYAVQCYQQRCRAAQ